MRKANSKWHNKKQNTHFLPIPKHITTATTNHLQFNDWIHTKNWIS